jgi:hypothetical protein
LAFCRGTPYTFEMPHASEKKSKLLGWVYRIGDEVDATESNLDEAELRCSDRTRDGPAPRINRGHERDADCVKRMAGLIEAVHTKLK